MQLDYADIFACIQPGFLIGMISALCPRMRSMKNRRCP